MSLRSPNVFNPNGIGRICRRIESPRPTQYFLRPQESPDQIGSQSVQPFSGAQTCGRFTYRQKRLGTSVAIALIGQDVDPFSNFSKAQAVKVTSKSRGHFTGYHHDRSAHVRHAFSMSRDHTVLPAVHAFIHKWNPNPLSFQPKLVLIY